MSKSRQRQRFSWNRGYLQLPDVVRVFLDSAVAGELAGACHVDNRPARPGLAVGIQSSQLLVGAGIVGEIRQMTVMIAVRQERGANGRETDRLLQAEVIGSDQVDRGAGFLLVAIVPVRIVPAGAVSHLLGRQPEKEEVLLAGLLGHFDGGAVAGADG